MTTNRSWDEPPPTKQSRVEDTAPHQPPSLDILLKSIPQDLQNKQCSKKFLAKVAKHLTKWRLLSPYLDMSDSDEDDIMETYQGNDLQKQRLLLRWRERFGKKATHSVLVRAILDMGKVDLAHKVCQMAKESSVGEVVDTPSSPLMGASTPSPAMLSYRDQLRHGYRTHKPVMVMEWPPPPALEYISLAMIKKNTVERGNITEDYIRTTIHGNMDDILHEKVPVEVDQLFSLDSDKRKVILVEGAPGSGKSTLLWHMCQKWQSGELFQQFTLVLLVLLRDPHIHAAQSLADILPCVPSRSTKYTPSEYRKTIASDIEDRHGEGVLIMLDGWDEAPANLQQKGSLIHDIIAEPSKCSVEAAAVVVSSRPSASHDIRKYTSSRVEVIGFTRERREEYVREILQDNPEAVHSLMQQIESDPKLGANCHLPLNLVIITHTFMCSGNTLPSTYCRIIITLALSCLLRHIQKSTPHDTAVQSLESFNVLPDGIREEFLKLCKLAYEGVVEEKYSFSSEDLTEITSTSVPQIMTFGLLQAVHSLVATGSSTVYHFLHLSLQELCAAHHIASLPSPEKRHVKALRRMICESELAGDDPKYTLRTHFKPVCEFYSALTHLGKPQVVSQLYHIYAREEEDDYWDWDEPDPIIGPFKNEFFFKCLAEADNPKLTASFIHKSEKIGYIGWAVASAIALASHLESISCEGFNLFTSMALSGKPSLKNLTIYISHSIDMEHVKHVLTTCANLEGFVMDGEFGDAELFHLAEVINQTSICSLQLSGSEIGKAGIIALSSALKTNNTVQHLTVGCRDVEDDRAFFSSLKEIPSLIKFSMHRMRCLDPMRSFSNILKDPLSATCKTLLSGNLVELADILKLNIPSAVEKQLHIDLYNKVFMQVDFQNMCFLHLIIDDRVIKKKSRGIVKGKQLNKWPTKTVAVELDFSGHKIGDTGAKHLANVMVLEKLNISCCGIGEKGIGALSSSLTTLKCLNASGNNFGDKGAFHLAMALSHTSLQEIDISDCGIGEDGMIALSSALSTTTTLKCLKAYHNSFGDKGASYLAMALSHTSLEEIDISDCGVGEDGMVALSSALKTNSTLKCLKISGNTFGDKGASHLAEALSHTSLGEIAISGCGIGEDGMVALSSALKTNSTLKHLDISENQCRDEGIIALSSALSTNTALTHLKVSLEISGHSQVTLARAILQNTTLTSLNNDKEELCYNLIQVFREGELEFLESMFTCEVTQELLRDTNTFYTGIKRSPIIQCVSIDRTSSLGQALWTGNTEEVAEILELNLPPAVEKTLHIRMSNNTWEVDYGARTVRETDEGLLKIRSVYNDRTSWSSLHELKLKHTVVGGIGACLLAEMLNETQIQELDISYCNISEDGIVALSFVLGTNTTLKYLAIGGNNIKKRGQKALARALLRNTTLAVLDISNFNTGTLYLLKDTLRNYNTFSEDQGHTFFLTLDLKHSSLDVIFLDNYTVFGAQLCHDHMVGNEHCWHIVLNLKTRKILFNPPADPYDLAFPSGDSEEDSSSTDSFF